jgi:hypothetical protein
MASKTLHIDIGGGQEKVKFPNILDGRMHYREEIEKCKEILKLNVVVRSVLTSFVIMIAFVENHTYITNGKVSDSTNNSLRVVILIFNMVMVWLVVKYYH